MDVEIIFFKQNVNRLLYITLVFWGHLDKQRNLMSYDLSDMTWEVEMK